MANIRIPTLDVFKIRLWLNVYEKLCPMGADELWTKSIITPFAPREGDSIHLWPNEDGDDAVMWSVRRHYWSWSGLYSCELTYMVVDPNEQDYTANRGYHNHLYSRAWRTELDGRPEPGLRRGGWITHREYREQQQQQ